MLTQKKQKEIMNKIFQILEEEYNLTHFEQIAFLENVKSLIIVGYTLEKVNGGK